MMAKQAVHIQPWQCPECGIEFDAQCSGFHRGDNLEFRIECDECGCEWAEVVKRKDVPLHMEYDGKRYDYSAVKQHDKLVEMLEIWQQEADWVRRMVHSLGVFARNDISSEKSTALSDSVQGRLTALLSATAALLAEEKE